MPPAPVHNVPVPFFYRQLQEPDARVREMIPLWQGTSGFLANSKDHCVKQPLWLYNEVVRELELKTCSARHLLSPGDFECRRLVALPKRPGFMKASQLIYAVLVSQLYPLLASDLTTSLLGTVASFFLRKGSCADLFPTHLTLAFSLSHPTSSSSLKNPNKEFCQVFSRSFFPFEWPWSYLRQLSLRYALMCKGA